MLMADAQMPTVHSILLPTHRPDSKPSNLNGVVTKVHARGRTKVFAPRVPVCSSPSARMQSSVRPKDLLACDTTVVRATRLMMRDMASFSREMPTQSSGRPLMSTLSRKIRTQLTHGTHLTHFARLVPNAQVVLIDSVLLAADGADAKLSDLNTMVPQGHPSRATQRHGPRIPIPSFSV